MPAGPWHYPEDQVSDASERSLAAEVTREQLFRQLHEELPYASAVETEQFKEREDGSVEIHQQVMVERPTQRAIVLGKGGARIKEIGEKARARTQRLMGPPRPPLPPRQGPPRLGRKPRGLSRHRAGLGGLILALSRMRERASSAASLTQP